MSRPTGDSDDVAAPRGAREESELEETYERLVDEGHERLDRPLLPLVATGVVGGVDVGVGVLIYLVVKAETGDHLLASLGFTVGFVALLLAHSELFTENFLVPVISVVAKVGTVAQLLRLWGVTLVANLVGGLLVAGLIVVALPSVHEVAVESGTHFAELGVSWESFCLAVLAGVVITLLTRMQSATQVVGVQVVAAVMMSFVLVGAELFHSVLDSILIFAGLLTGDAGYGWADWPGALAWAAFGNLVGGLVLVTGLRLLRISHRVQESRDEGQTG